MSLTIRPATPDDAAAIWAVIEPAIRAGETYALDRNLPQADAVAIWLAPDRQSFVAEADGDVVGCYYLKTNQPGGGAHVCNCGYVTAQAATGRGVARAMCTHSLETARKLGYSAMQFNFVVETNARAIRLWESMGFDTVGRLSQAFRHPQAGLVDARVMFRAL